MAYPNPLPSSGQISLIEIDDWLYAAGYKTAARMSLANLVSVSNLADKTAPYSLSNFHGYSNTSNIRITFFWSGSSFTITASSPIPAAIAVTYTVYYTDEFGGTGSFNETITMAQSSSSFSGDYGSSYTINDMIGVSINNYGHSQSYSF